MTSRSEEIAGLFEAPESFDPADIDGLGDDTTAGSRKPRKIKSEAPIETGATDRRLRLRAGVPVIEKYKGKAVKRKDVFNDDDAVGKASGMGVGADIGFDNDIFMGADEADGDAGPTIANVPGGLSISGDLDKEYAEMMKRTQKELTVMRTPSVSELQKKEKDAASLKKELEAWNALLELRIHLESALSIGHRLPSGESCDDLRAADPAAVGEAGALGTEVRTLMSTLLALQQSLARQHELPKVTPASGSQEGDAWNAVEARIQPMLDWSLTVADAVKEKTRLDVRKGFKVLDQSLGLQMRASEEMEPAKLRKRCTPPPGRHKIIGSSSAATVDGESVAIDDAAEKDVYDDHEFYVQLLREVLGGGSSKDESVAEQAKQMQNELQGRRANKKRARTDVERRASKGRKVRYVPIEKLQNFMAPGSRSAQKSNGDALPVELNSVDALMQALFARTGS